MIPISTTPVQVPQTAPMMGVPVVVEGPKQLPPRAQESKQPPVFRTELIHSGRLSFAITPKQVRERISLLEKTGLSRTDRARAQIRVGEGYLGLKEPSIAEDWFLKAAKSAIQDSTEFGIARYNIAIALFRQGRYQESTEAFFSVLNGRAPGFDRRTATAFHAEAKSCAGYHKIREDAGITEPFHLDPLCGPAAVARVLKTLGKPHAEKDIVSRVKHTGEGSSFDDLIEAAPAFGLKAFQIRLADDEALKKLFKLNGGTPIIARVEHDHFVAVGGADEKGVTYYCSDCGEWPGGEKKLTWKQWRLMEADAFLAVAPVKSDYLAALEMLPKPESKVLDARWMRQVGTVSAAQTLFGQLVAAGVGIDFDNFNIFCGNPATTKICICRDCCAEVSSGPPMSNVATGSSETGFPFNFGSFNNSGGPSITLTANYHSQTSMRSELGEGVGHQYNVGVYAKFNDRTRPGGGRSGDGPPGWFGFGEIVEETGGTIPFTYEGGPEASATNPRIQCTVTDSSYYSVKVFWVWDSSVNSQRMEVQFKSGAKWLSEPFNGTAYNHTPGSYPPIPSEPTGYHPIQKMYDPLGNWIEIVRAPYPGRFDGTGPEPRITSIKDQNGTTLLTFNLDSDGFATSIVDSTQRKIITTIDYIANTDIPTGFPQGGRYLKAISQPVIATASTGPAAVQYTYENLNNGEGSEKTPLLKTISMPSPTGTGLSTWTYLYSEANGSPSQLYTTVSGIVDPNGNTKEFLDNGANKVKVRTKNASNVVVEEYSLQYNSDMQITQVINADGHVVKTTEFAGANFEPTRHIFHYDPNDPTKDREETFEYDGYRNLVYYTGPTGVSTRTTYDYSNPNFWGGLPTEVQQGTGTSPTNFIPSRAKKTFAYYPNGLLQTASAPVPGQVGVNSTMQSTNYTYDSLGNILTIVSPGNNAESTHTTTFTYSQGAPDPITAKKGQPIKITNSKGESTHFRYDNRGNLISTKDALNNTTTYLYNIADQRTHTILPATGSSGSGQTNLVSSYKWIGGPVGSSYTFSEGNSTVPFRTVNYTYGKVGESLSRTGDTEVVTMTYDDAYRTKTVSDGMGGLHKTTYTYDNKGQVTQVDNPMASGADFDRIKFNAYDLQGNLLTRVDGRGHTTNFVYAEPSGKLSQIQYPNATTENVTLSYDSFGRPISWSNGTGSETTAYDESNMILSRTTTYAGMTGSKTISYGYYPDGSRQSMTHPGDTWGYTYDKAGRCTGFSTTEGASSFAYDSAGRMSIRQLPGDISTEYSYNQLGLLENLMNKSDTIYVKSSFENLSYDGAFNLIGLQNEVDGVPNMTGNVQFAYDTKDRLTSEVSTRYGGYTEVNAYDNAGNPTTFQNYSGTPPQTAIPYNYANQRTGANFVYDGNGNPTKWRDINATFDRENRMLSYGGQTNGYRADNLRAWKQDENLDATSRKYFLYDNGNVICELNAGGTVVARNAFAPDGLVSRVAGSTTLFYLFDQQGNVVNILDEDNEDAIFFAYNAWGIRNYDLNVPGKGALKQPFSYNGKWGYYRDSETELYYCQNRFYDPSVGRWLTRDPIGFTGGINLFGYCGSRPVGFIDRDGLVAFQIGIGAGAGIGFGGDIEAGIYFDTETGDFGPYGSVGGWNGASAEGDVSLCVGMQQKLNYGANGSPIAVNHGPGWSGGGGAGIVVGVGGDLTRESPGFSAKVGAGAGVEVQGRYGGTVYFSLPRAKKWLEDQCAPFMPKSTEEWYRFGK
ncbi:RHS repeat-associated core domain-containing protein [Microcoleus sp. B7-D4]|uniref:RHS repeat-associated core domain-containing protein n=1 Tax=Microcoleus sp. B7-D4 TaxID=2818696 RepID=UPI002FD77297